MSHSPFTYAEYAYPNHDENHRQQKRHFHDLDHIDFHPDHIAIAIAARQLLATLAAQKLLLLPPAEAKSMVSMDGFKVCMDVHQFQPKEITVKTVGNVVVVEGKHEERPDDYGFISRQFIRKYILPNGYEPNEVASTLSSDGVLVIKCPPPNTKTEGQEHSVHVELTGPAMQNFGQNKAQQNGDKQTEDKKKTKPKK